MKRDIQRRFLILRDCIKIQTNYKLMHGRKVFCVTNKNNNEITTPFIKNPNAINFVDDNFGMIPNYKRVSTYISELIMYKFNNHQIYNKFKHCICWPSLFYFREDKISTEFAIKNFDDLCTFCDLTAMIEYMSDNKYAVSLLEQYLEDIDWGGFSRNENALHILEKNIDKIEWYWLCQNKNAIHLIEKNVDKLDDECWQQLSANSNAYELLKNNKDKINWERLAQNKNPQILKLIYDEEADYKEVGYTNEYYEGITWRELSRNPNALFMLKKNINKINWHYLCGNENPCVIKLFEGHVNKLTQFEWEQLCMNPDAIYLIERNLDKLNDACWKKLNCNPNGMYILERYQDKIEWSYNDHDNVNNYCIFDNPSIFTYNYKEIKEIKHNINKDFVEWVWKPENMDKWTEWKL
jgi:hypothetical protein